ncbi:MAG: hypothetical protein GWP07_00675 [Xanthomonadaceae bacterium]|nr:hypothetical protein [Xanthomonadaceae bacterium]
MSIRPVPAQLSSLHARLGTTNNIIRSLRITIPEENQQLDKWLATIHELLQLSDQFSLPITVIGPVKSGKSTLLNTLIGQNILPMGAGITTTFVTAIRHGNDLHGEISLIPPKQVDNLFQNSCHFLFATDLTETEVSLFEHEDRQRIKQLLADFSQKNTLTHHGSFDKDYQLLKDFLAGYDHVADYYQREQLSLSFSQEELGQFRRFITTEPVSTFLKQATVFFPFTILPKYVIMQDCQGLDTPSPGQQALAIQQLATSPVLIYVISSRMGLRQADYHLLEHLHDLGLASKLLFVLNYDLAEHPSRKNMDEIFNRCRQELAELGFDQPCYAFSALYHFYDQLKKENSLGKSEEQRWLLWREEAEKLELSSTNWKSFTARLRELTGKQADEALLWHLNSRIMHIAGRSHSLVVAKKKSLSWNRQEIDSSVYNYEKHKEKLRQIEEQLGTTLNSITNQCEREYFRKIESWFNQTREDGIRPVLQSIIESYHIPEDLLPAKNRNPLLPMKLLERHFQQVIHPQLQEKLEISIHQFWQMLEKEIISHYSSQSDSLFFLLEKATGNDVDSQDRHNFPSPINWNSKLPEFSFSDPLAKRFSAVSKFSLIGKLLSNKMKQLRKKRSWRETISHQLQQQARNELKSRLLDYQERLKFLFLRPYLAKYERLVSDYLADFIHISTLEMSHQQNGLHDQGQQQKELYEVLNNQENELEQLIKSLNNFTITTTNL